jgi:hypothetical protein
VNPNDDVNGISGVEDATPPVSFIPYHLRLAPSKAVEVNAVAEVLIQ